MPRHDQLQGFKNRSRGLMNTFRNRLKLSDAFIWSKFRKKKNNDCTIEYFIPLLTAGLPHMLTVPVVGVGKRRAHSNWSMGLLE